MNNEIKVTTHVGRDVLQTAGLFTSVASVVWEYVINGLEYREINDPRRASISITIKPRNKEIQIKDNGLGMNVERINHFLTMHGDQIQEEKKFYRSKFGSGKSAAFAIANTLEVDTYSNGKRNKFRLTKEALKASDGSDISPEILISEEDSDEENGTLILIKDINVTLNQEEVIKVIERHLPELARFDPEITVNDHVCEKKQLDIVEKETFFPDPEGSKIIGKVELEINVSRSPLISEEVGIFISAGEGNLIAKEDLGLASVEEGNLITGSINVPCLTEEVDGLVAYSQARNNELNKDHKYVKVLITFLAASVEEVRRKLVKAKKEKKESEEGRKLQQLGNEISEILNESYLDKQKELERIRRGAFGSLAKKLMPAYEDEDSSEMGIFAGGVETRAEEEEGLRDGDSKENPLSPENPPPESLNEDEEGAKSADRKPSRPRPQRKGGFHVECEHLGTTLKTRYQYVKEEVTIKINLDHPSVSYSYLNANKNIQDIHFKRLIYEIAFTAYILAVAQEITEVDEMKSGADLRFDMQELYDEVTLKAAKSLYA